MNKTIASVFIAALILFQNIGVASAVTPVNINNDINTRIDQINSNLEKYRDENYQKAISSAKDAGDKADRFLNAVIFIAALFGGVITIITFFVGGNMISILNSLKRYQKSAREHASAVEEIAKKAEAKYKLYEKSIKKIKGKPAVEVEQILSKMKEGLMELQALRRSATFISNTTPSSSPSLSSSGSLDNVLNSSPSMSVNSNKKVCFVCGLAKDYSDFYIGGDDLGLLALSYGSVCSSCRKAAASG